MADSEGTLKCPRQTITTTNLANIIQTGIDTFVPQPLVMNTNRRRVRQSARNNISSSGSNESVEYICKFVESWLTYQPKQQVLELEMEWSLDKRFSTRQVSVARGVGKILEIDEAEFAKRKYNMGRIIEVQWTLGGVERGSNKIF